MPNNTNSNASSFIIINKKHINNFKQPLQTTISSGRSYNNSNHTHKRNSRHNHNYQSSTIEKTQRATSNHKSGCKIIKTNNNNNWFTYTSANGISHKVIVNSNNNRKIDNNYHHDGQQQKLVKNKHQLKLDQKQTLNLKNSNTFDLRDSKSKSKDNSIKQHSNPSKSQLHSHRQSFIYKIDNNFCKVEDQNKENISQNIMRRKDELRVFEKEDLTKLSFMLEKELKQGKTLSKKKWLTIVDNNKVAVGRQSSERIKNESLQKNSMNNENSQLFNTTQKQIKSSKKPSIRSARSKQMQRKQEKLLKINNKKGQTHNNSQSTIISKSNRIPIGSTAITADERNYSIKQILNTLTLSQQQQVCHISSNNSKHSNNTRKIEQCLTTDDNDNATEHQIIQQMAGQTQYQLINQYENKIATLYEQLIQEKQKRYRLQDIIETYITAKEKQSIY